MKKILTLFALLVGFATGAWAGPFDGKIIKSKGEAATTMQAGTYIMYNQTHSTYFNLSSAGQLHLDPYSGNFVGSGDVNYVVNIVEGTTPGTWAFQVSNGKYIPQLSRGATTGQSETPYYFTMSYDAGWTIQETAGNLYYMNGNGPGSATFAGWGSAHKYTLYPVELAEAPKAPVEAGKCYYIYNDNYSDGADVKYYLNYNESALGIHNGKVEDAAYMWRCEKNGATYAFRNVMTGTYLGWQAFSKTAYYYTIGNSNQQSGFYTLKGTEKYLVIPNNGSKFDQSTHPNYAKNTSGYSADFQFEECDPSAFEYDWQYLFRTTGAAHPYRIPAIAQTPSGRIIALSDYRTCGNDIGYGRVDIVGRISEDNGKTWGDEFMVLEGDGIDNSPTCGYGDAALVADRESNDVMLMCVSAPKNGTCWTAQQRGVVTVSHDGGLTWPKPVDIKDKICNQPTSLIPGVINYFVGSGKLHQSRYTKVGSHYRVYAALWTTPDGSNYNNYVIYTDDFGLTWNLLGSSSTPCVAGGNEPKCEELPDGSVIISARKGAGRYYNVWTWTEMPTKANPAGVGSWGSRVEGCPSGDSSNGTDGEILILNVKKSDDSVVPIALQSMPDNGRSHVSIWYKELSSDPAHAYSSSEFSGAWTKGLQVSCISSAYSTMILQEDGSIGFYYEEGPATYEMVYANLSIEQITLNHYKSILPELPSEEYRNAVSALKSAYNAKATAELGNDWLDYNTPNPAALTAALAAAEPYAYKSAITLLGEGVSIATLNELTAALEACTLVQNCKKGCFVRLKGYSGNYVSGNKIASGVNAAMDAATDASTLFYLSPEGELICYGTGMGFVDTRDVPSSIQSSYSRFTISASGRTDKYYVRCNSNTNASIGTYLYDNTAIGGKLDRNGSPVTSGSYQTDWTLIEVTELPVNINTAGFATYSSPVQMKVPAGVTAHTAVVDVTDKANPTIAFTQLENGVIPANTAVLLKGTASTQVTLTADNSTVTTPAVNDLHGTVAAQALIQTTATTDADAYYYVLSGDKFMYATTKVNGFRGYLLIDLPYNAGTSSNFRMIFDGEQLPTGIEAIETLPADAAIYDLQGRRLHKTQQGINIVNGHKVIVK